MKKVHDIKKNIDWLNNEMTKDKLHLEQMKTKLINDIKSMNIETIVPQKPKMTLWERIKKKIMGI